MYRPARPEWCLRISVTLPFLHLLGSSTIPTPWRKVGTPTTHQLKVGTLPPDEKLILHLIPHPSSLAITPYSFHFGDVKPMTPQDVQFVTTLADPGFGQRGQKNVWGFTDIAQFSCSSKVTKYQPGWNSERKGTRKKGECILNDYKCKNFKDPKVDHQSWLIFAHFAEAIILRYIFSYISSSS